MQTTSTVLMVRPVRFGFNEQTAVNNAFQKQGFEDNAQAAALREFDNYVKLLRNAGVEVLVIDDTAEPHTPDSIFPNNWFSTHAQGELVLYPLCAPNRRLERKATVIDLIKKNTNPTRVIDLSKWEEKNIFLEGTGSMILDRENMILYACLSPRTSEEVIEEFAEELGYDYLLFNAVDEQGTPIYHTNVMMSVASEYVIACLDSIRDIDERESFVETVEEFDKELIEITFEQMNNFAGNMLEVKNVAGESILVMSARAKSSLTEEQLAKLAKYSKIVAPDLETIENNGGGSARCMVAEIFRR